MNIGNNIKKWREARGLKQSELAEILGVSDKTISSWEINRTEPKMGMVEKISNALNCKKIDIIGEEEPTYATSVGDLLSHLPSGYSLGGDYAEGYLWLIYPDQSTVEVSAEELENIIDDCESYMEFKLMELKRKEQRNK